MLSEKPWKFEAILRLLLSVFICHFLGTVLVTAIRFARHGPADKAALFYGLVAGCAILSVAALFVVRKAWELERFTRQFVTLLVCLYFGLTLGWLAQHIAGRPSPTSPTWQTAAAALSFQGAVLLFSGRFVREHQQRWTEAFGFDNRWPGAVVLGLFVTAVFLPVGWALQNLSAEVMSRMHLEPEVQPAVQALQNTVSWMDRAFLGCVAIGLAPIAEEILFRGILYPAIKRAGFPRLAVWITSLLFAGIHWNLLSFVPLLLLALLFTWLYEKTNNLLAPIAAHMIFNALNFARFLYLETRLGPPA